MKKNGNNTRAGEYYIGLDIGTSSVGYAVTDTEYRVLRHGGNSMWGVRLFDEGKTAEERRLCRTSRRRLARKNGVWNCYGFFLMSRLPKSIPDFFKE